MENWQEEIYRIFINEKTLAMDMIPYNPAVGLAVNNVGPIPLQPYPTKIDLLIYVIKNVLSMRQNLRVEDRPLGSKEQVVWHECNGTYQKLVLEFKLFTDFDVIKVSLDSRTRTSTIKFDVDRVPSPETFNADIIIKTRLMNDVITSMSHVFAKQMFDPLDRGQSLVPLAKSSAGSSGASTPGCIFVGNW